MRQGLRLRTRWIIGLRLSDLEPMTTLVAHTLAGWANADGLGVRPSLLSIANGCRVDRRTVVRHTKKLEDEGWVRRRSGRGVPNRYTLLIPTEIEARIEAALGPWDREVGTPQSLPSEEVGTLCAPSRDTGVPEWGHGSHPSLTEPYKEQPTSAIDPFGGSPTHTESETDGDAPWADHPKGWEGWLEDQKRSEESASEARVEERLTARRRVATIGTRRK